MTGFASVDRARAVRNASMRFGRTACVLEDQSAKHMELRASRLETTGSIELRQRRRQDGRDPRTSLPNQYAVDEARRRTLDESRTNCASAASESRDPTERAPRTSGRSPVASAPPRRRTCRRCAAVSSESAWVNAACWCAWRLRDQCEEEDRTSAHRRESDALWTGAVGWASERTLRFFHFEFHHVLTMI